MEQQIFLENVKSSAFENTQGKVFSMSFQSYLKNIEAKTEKSADDFRKLAAQKGFTDSENLKEGVKAGDIVKWLKEDFKLGHGHAMAIYALLKGTKSEDSK